MKFRGCLIATMLIVALTGCGRDKPKPAPTPQPPPPAEKQESAKTAVPPPPPAEPQVLEGSGVTAWAKGFEGQLIAGLDGGLYEAYARKIVQHVQEILKERGLYQGEVNGILDRPTMKSLHEFQEANANLQRCGVPTPHTRILLEQGSHTDVDSSSHPH